MNLRLGEEGQSTVSIWWAVGPGQLGLCAGQRSGFEAGMLLPKQLQWGTEVAEEQEDGRWLANGGSFFFKFLI